jgi:N-acetylglucosaminyldiphosphoundecaprenol N-acetyl-beta-D-mannosaminyltransferase
MSFSTLSFFDVRIDVVDEATAVAHIIQSLDAAHGGWVVTPNVDQLRILTARPELRRVVGSAELSVADGMPLIWASRIQGTPLPERVSGSRLIWSLTEAAAAAGKSVFLLGGTSHDQGVLAGEVLRKTYPELAIAGTYCPPYGFEEDENEVAAIRHAVSAANPDIVFCGLGFPKQELLVQDLRDVAPQAWFVACGASIAMVAGERSQAPKWMEKSGLEWLHRLRQEPGRLFQRYVIHDMPFAVRLLGTSAQRRMRHSRHPDQNAVSNSERRETLMAERKPDVNVVVLAWTKISGRQMDLAHQLAGEVKIIYPDQRLAKKNPLARYLLSTKQTIGFLRRSDYDVLIVTAPPVETAILCAVFRRRTKPFILDSHPGAFGLGGNVRSARLQAIHRWLWTQASCVLVTTSELADKVRAGRGRALVFHEPPGSWQEDPQTLLAGEPGEPTTSRRVCVPFIFTRDEPVDILFAAARYLPDVEFRVTGNPEWLPKEIEVPSNITLVGFLNSEQFLRELHSSDVVVVLSTEPQSVMRTAYEAIRLDRPMVVTDTKATREFFPFAQHAENSPVAISDAVRILLQEGAVDSGQRTSAAAEFSRRITEDQMAELREVIATAAGREG